jgi:hypothetical protein
MAEVLGGNQHKIRRKLPDLSMEDRDAPRKVFYAANLNALVCGLGIGI